MNYIRADKKYAEQVFELVQDTITAIYPNYYPREVVDFFCRLHSRESIAKDIKNGCINILLDGESLLGTGSFEENRITRVYIAPTFQGRGYGSYLMERLENEIAQTHHTVCLDASLPASHLYESRGYKTMKHEKWIVENGVVLVYEIMEKQLFSFG